MKGFARARRGFTLLEAIIGFCILSSAAVIFFQTVHKFKKETVFYSEHLIASSLQEKIVEQCYQETEVNPYGLQTLGMADATQDTSSMETFITDGQTVLFQYPEITARDNKELHEILKENFKLGVKTVKQSGYHQINATFDWSANYGQGISQSFCKVLSVSGKKEVFTDLDLSNLAVEERLLQEVFGVSDTSVTSLNETLPSIGAQNLILSVGHIHYSCSDLISSGEFLERCKKAGDKENSFSADSTEYEECSKEFFAIARDMLHLMISLQPRIKTINDNLSFINQIPEPQKKTVKDHLVLAAYFYQQVRNVFLACALKLIARYEKQLAHCFNLRDQRNVVARIFNLYRIIYLNSSFCGQVITSDSPELRIKKKYFNFLETVIAFFQNRDPSLERMAIQEKTFAEKNLLKQKHYIPGLVNDIFIQIDSLAESARAISPRTNHND